MAGHVSVVISLVLFVAVWVGPAVICFMKGKPWFALLGLFVVAAFSIVGAIRLAKPTSSWARRYDDAKLAESIERFPDDARKLDPAGG